MLNHANQAKCLLHFLVVEFQVLVLTILISRYFPKVLSVETISIRKFGENIQFASAR